MIFLNSPPTSKAPEHVSKYNASDLWAHFHGIDNSVEYHDREVKETVNKFDGHIMEAYHNKSGHIGGDHESGPSYNCSEKNKKKPGKRQGEKVTRRHKFAFQTRSQVDVLDDGYRWRKYGQKTVKNSKFPRSYYKCTYQGCNVKKQIQRHCKDEGIVVTTYEGMHTHPLERSVENFDQILKGMRTSY
ncbi:putative WRKY transcription factor 75 [Morus notabilis]|uniref:Putative WRKY transcription factor 75 n=2 Tax=Morus notabilis TaxID=981085 RepID=W9QX94_9ROSA|nr:putative WRKY transcription factor 75 [Morus notabilis]